MVSLCIPVSVSLSLCLSLYIHVSIHVLVHMSVSVFVCVWCGMVSIAQAGSARDTVEPPAASTCDLIPDLPTHCTMMSSWVFLQMQRDSHGRVGSTPQNQTAVPWQR